MKIENAYFENAKTYTVLQSKYEEIKISQHCLRASYILIDVVHIFPPAIAALLPREPCSLLDLF